MDQPVRPSTATVKISKSKPISAVPTPSTPSITAQKSTDNAGDLEEYVSAPLLRELSGCDDLSTVTYLELQADTRENSLCRLGSLVPALTELKLSGSHIASLRDLGTTLRNLQVIWLSQCQLHDLDGISSLSSLTEVYLSFNHVKECAQLTMLPNLQVVDLEGNLISDLSQIEYLALCEKLERVTFDGNPFQIELKTKKTYRDTVFKLIPSLTALDDVPAGMEVPDETYDTDSLVHQLVKSRTDNTDPLASRTVRPSTARPCTRSSKSRMTFLLFLTCDVSSPFAIITCTFLPFQPCALHTRPPTYPRLHFSLVA
eukprot:m.91157 g.91157  ORF g.91157 m.91157 type:complete len:315 (-) comp12940_c0_seq1:1696-2640(-)